MASVPSSRRKSRLWPVLPVCAVVAAVVWIGPRAVRNRAAAAAISPGDVVSIEYEYLPGGVPDFRCKATVTPSSPPGPDGARTAVVETTVERFFGPKTYTESVGLGPQEFGDLVGLVNRANVRRLPAEVSRFGPDIGTTSLRVTVAAGPGSGPGGAQPNVYATSWASGTQDRQPRALRELFDRLHALTKAPH